jgi:thiamine kinase-like enzyme
MHDVSTTVPFEFDATWSSEMADPLGGELFCHNDVCLENVVFRDEVAVGLLDFDFAARGDVSSIWRRSPGCASPSTTT